MSGGGERRRRRRRAARGLQRQQLGLAARPGSTPRAAGQRLVQPPSTIRIWRPAPPSPPSPDRAGRRLRRRGAARRSRRGPRVGAAAGVEGDPETRPGRTRARAARDPRPKQKLVGWPKRFGESGRGPGLSGRYRRVSLRLLSRGPDRSRHCSMEMCPGQQITREPCFSATRWNGVIKPFWESMSPLPRTAISAQSQRRTDQHLSRFLPSPSPSRRAGQISGLLPQAHRA